MKADRNTDKANRKQRGFTLLEFIVSIGFMSVLAGLISGSTFLSIKTTSETGAASDIAIQTARTTVWLVRDVHQAETTNIVDLAASVNTASFSWDDGGPVTCTLSLVGTDLQRDCGTSTVVIGSFISNLLFERSGDLITVHYLISPPGVSGKTQQVDINIALGGG
jgi:prepilin-type N-terminal cleavage/methylation domain-containing protein